MIFLLFHILFWTTRRSSSFAWWMLTWLWLSLKQLRFGKSTPITRQTQLVIRVISHPHICRAGEWNHLCNYLERDDAVLFLESTSFSILEMLLVRFRTSTSSNGVHDPDVILDLGAKIEATNLSNN